MTTCKTHLFLSLKEVALSFLLLLLSLLGKIFVIELLHINPRDVNLGGSCNQIRLVDSPKRNTVDLKWSYSN